MKKTILFMLLFTLILACKKKDVNLDSLTQVKQITDNSKQTKESLKNLKPITKKQIKNWMPDSLNGLTRVSYNIGRQMDSNTFKLVYKNKETNKNVNISILDGAGNGSNYLSMFAIFTNMEIDKETEQGYERTMIFDNQRSLVNYKKHNDYEQSKITCVLNKRFGIEAIGNKMQPNELWNHIKKLKINTLTDN